MKRARKESLKTLWNDQTYLSCSSSFLKSFTSLCIASTLSKGRHFGRLGRADNGLVGGDEGWLKSFGSGSKESLYREGRMWGDLGKQNALSLISAVIAI